MPRFSGSFLLFSLLLWLGAATAAAEFKVVVKDQVLHKVDHRLFGQFLERASFGEPGPEAFADPATGQLPTNIVAKLKELRIPVLRFPGGTDVDRVDWTDMIDNVPGRPGPRPITNVQTNKITNRFGYDEFFALRDELRCATILVLNVVDALAKRKPLAEAVAHAAGLVAYANAPLGTRLPEGMKDWPAVRAKNGRAQPLRAEYLQLGNEWSIFHKQVSQACGLTGKPLADWYLEVLHAYIRTIRAIDPEVKLILDGNLGDDLEQIILRDPTVRQAVRYVTFHRYAPGPVGPVRRNGTDVSPVALSAADWWYASSSLPGCFVNGLNVGLGDDHRLARSLGYRIACTEWNWNGWGFGDAPESFQTAQLPVAKTIGVAGFLHGLMRQGDAVDLATQSMLLGHKWNISAVRADPTGTTAPWFSPQGLATLLYSQHHGDWLLAIAHGILPAHVQPYVVGRWTRWPETGPIVVAYLDMLVTADDRSIYVHAINRHFEEAQELKVDLTALGISASSATHYRCEDGRQITSQPAEAKAGILQVTLPPRSLSIIEVKRTE